VEVSNELDALTAVGSDDWAARAAAGRWLANNAQPAYLAELLVLLTDSRNTAVSMDTAWALLQNPSEFTMSTVLRALTAADEETLDHLLFVVTPFVFQPTPPVALRQALDRCLAMNDDEVAAGLSLAGLT
jgi:hypothetical protein